MIRSEEGKPIVVYRSCVSQLIVRQNAGFRLSPLHSKTRHKHSGTFIGIDDY